MEQGRGKSKLLKAIAQAYIKETEANSFDSHSFPASTGSSIFP